MLKTKKAIIVLLLHFFLIGEGAYAENTQSKDALIAISNAYTANLSSFVHGQIHFEFAQSALPESPKAAGYCVFDKSRCLYSLVYADSDLLADARPVPGRAAGERAIASSLLTFRLLTDGKDTLTEKIYADPAIGKVRRVTQITPESGDAIKRVFLPLSVWNFNGQPGGLLSDINSLLDSKSDVKLIRLEKDKASQLLVLEMAVGPHQRTYWIDQEKGSIPTLVHAQSATGRTFDIINSDLRLVPEVGWLPFQVEYKTDGNVDRRLTIFKADFTTKPSDSLYSLTFKEPVAILHTRLKTRLDDRSSVGLRDLSYPSMKKATRVAVSTSPALTEPKVASDNRNSGRLYYGVAGLLICAILMGIYRWVRKWRT